MLDLMNCKFVEAIRPAAIVDDAAFTSVEIDTLGFDAAVGLFHYGTSDIALAALGLEESDTSGSGFAAVADFTFSSLPSSTADGSLYGMFIDLRKRKRYLKITATAGNGSAGTYASATMTLYRGKTGASSATLRGLAAELVA